MQLYHIIPELKPYIKVICSLELNGTVNPLMRVLPDTCVELFVNYKENTIGTITNSDSFTSRRSFLNSRMSSYMDVQMHPDAGCIALCFMPGTAYRFFDVPMHEITDSTIELETLWKGIATEMEDRVANASNNEKRVRIIQEYLLAALIKKQKDEKNISYCLHQLNGVRGQMTVREMAATANLGNRQLNRKFNDCIGLSPKEYARVNRFMHSLQLLKNNTTLSLTEIAYESGYYDQAHFIHECKAYTGYTPGALMQAAHVIY